jgi:hypothetical protein
MKMFLIFWLCIQNPTLPLDKTCVQEVVYDKSYDTVEECRLASQQLATYLTDRPNVYVTTFCTTKISPNI